MWCLWTDMGLSGVRKGNMNFSINWQLPGWLWPEVDPAQKSGICFSLYLSLSDWLWPEVDRAQKSGINFSLHLTSSDWLRPESDPFWRLAGIQLCSFQDLHNTICRFKKINLLNFYLLGWNDSSSLLQLQDATKLLFCNILSPIGTSIILEWSFINSITSSGTSIPSIWPIL